MKINWKLRLKNKTTLLALFGCISTFLYQILGIFGVVAPVTEDVLMQMISTALNLLVTVGVVVDPTTSGISDSSQAMSYQEPK